MRILLVDDQPMLLSALSTILNTQPDIEVVATGANGKEAIEQAENHDIDVAVLDIRMPVLDGISAARQIMPLGPKVIMLTTFDDDARVQEAIEAGVHAFSSRTRTRTCSPTPSARSPEASLSWPAV